jgi:EAL domain-containing protein (putative c-di-GMP-specific phosphodiesterase class I)/GGDEF domain-containing protein
MSLIRQVWLLVLGIIVFALVGSVASSIWTARGYLETQLALKNSDNAQSLALTLSQQGGDVGLIELALSAQFDIGHYRSIRLQDERGRVLAARVAGPVEPDVPRWFSRWVAIESRPGIAQVSSGWAPIGQVEVISQPSFAYADLWRGAWTTAAWMALVGVVAALVAHLAVRRLRRPLDAAVAQAQALSQRRYLTQDEPRVPELREVSRAMNLMVERVRTQFSEQAAQVDTLRQQANGDALTGLSHRAHFLSCLHAGLSQDDVPVEGQLLLVRLLGLAEMNLQQGHQATDAMLQSLARRLEAPIDGATPQAVGRLNGSDFAVLYGADAQSADLPEALMARLRATVAPHTEVALVLSAVRLRQDDSETAVLTRADAGLACAEARGRFEIEVVDRTDPLAQAGGEASWRVSILDALRQGRVRMGQFPVVDRSGRLLHTECPLRLQVSPGGDFQVAARWLPHAMRTGLAPEVDACAIDLALRAIALDQQPRCVNISPRSLLDSTFLPRMAARLRADPEATRSLWIEVDASVLLHHAAALGELSARLRPLGVRVGVEHAGDRLPTGHAVVESGLDYVKLAQTASQGVAADAARLSLLTGVVSMLHGLGLAVYAEGLADVADVAACWTCGVDGVTGPAI